jgi:hypothetical protein
MLFRSDVITFGATLARKMKREDVEAILDMIDRGGRVVGIAHIVLARGISPNRLEVHFLPPEGLTPEECIQPLAIAAQQLMELHGKPASSPIVVSRVDAERALVIASHLVDSIREGHLSRDGLMTRIFDLSRQNAIRDVLFALLAAPLSPTKLSRET